MKPELKRLLCFTWLSVAVVSEGIAQAEPAPVSVVVLDRDLKTAKPFTIRLINATGKTITFCTEFTAKTADGVQPHPNFEVKRKYRGAWNSQLAPSDLGRAIGSDSLTQER